MAASVDPVEAFHLRCEANAYLVGVGEYDLHDAVDALQEHAIRHGLIDEIGQTAVQAIMAEAFRPAREMERAA